MGNIWVFNAVDVQASLSYSTLYYVEHVGKPDQTEHLEITYIYIFNYQKKMIS